MINQINLIRSIGSEFINRKFRTAVIILAIVATVTMALSIWLTTISEWWWILAVPVIGMTLLGIALIIAARVIIIALRPEITKNQRKEVKKFVDKLERVADNIQTPMPLILFNVIRDIIRPRDKTFIAIVTEDSTSLKKDLSKLQNIFK